jgi:hypothetical protein
VIIAALRLGDFAINPNSEIEKVASQPRLWAIEVDA